MNSHAPKSKKLSLDELVFSALSQLQVLHYNQRSIRRYQTVWRKLVTLAQQQGYKPVKSVGVVGDARRYAPVIVLRAVETTDYMTARWAHLPYELIGLISNRIINENSGICRVVYDVSNKPPATIEWE